LHYKFTKIIDLLISSWQNKNVWFWQKVLLTSWKVIVSLIQKNLCPYLQVPDYKVCNCEASYYKCLITHQTIDYQTADMRKLLNYQPLEDVQYCSFWNMFNNMVSGRCLLLRSLEDVPALLTDLIRDYWKRGMNRWAPLSLLSGQRTHNKPIRCLSRCYSVYTL